MARPVTGNAGGAAPITRRGPIYGAFLIASAGTEKGREFEKGEGDCLLGEATVAL